MNYFSDIDEALTQILKVFDIESDVIRIDPEDYLRDPYEILTILKEKFKEIK